MDTWQLGLGAFLTILSMLIYYAQVVIFDNPHDTFFYLLQDLAFVPMQVLLITILVNHLLERREKKILMKKMNMLIGVFFSEVGTELVKLFFAFDSSSAELRRQLHVTAAWDSRQFAETAKALREAPLAVDARRSDLTALTGFLHDKRSFLMGLLANPNLLEHDTFTDLMWAVFHLTEELGHRTAFTSLPNADYEHISTDIARVYGLLVAEWLFYMNYLRKDYPYLFSLAVRTSPFATNSCVLIQD